MRFQPLSPEQLLAQRNILKEGPCDFQVLNAVDTTSKSGNPMVKLTLRIWDSDGKEGQIYDYLIISAQWKIAGFFEAINQFDLYKSGELSPDMIIGKSGKAKLGIEKDPTGQYGDKVKIKSYLKPKNQKDDTQIVPEQNEKIESILGGEDDIPF